jgi:hypothetical protein
MKMEIWEFVLLGLGLLFGVLVIITVGGHVGYGDTVSQYVAQIFLWIFALGVVVSMVIRR